MTAKRILVVYYSRTGFTRRIAEEIADACGADLEEVRDVKSRRGPFGFLRSGYEASRRKLPEIKETTADPAQYDVVVIGTPVWAGNVASPIRSYVAKQRDALKAVALFCTMGGKSSGKTLPELSDACGRKPLTAIALGDKEIKTGAHRTAVERLIQAVMGPRLAAAS